MFSRDIERKLQETLDQYPQVSARDLLADPRDPRQKTEGPQDQSEDR